MSEEVTNQPPPLTGGNAWRGDPLLIQLAERFSESVRKDLDGIGRFVLTQEAQDLARLANAPDLRLLHGLHLCVHHPRLGAERAASLGCSERTVWLIAHHEDRGPGGDAELIALQRADRG